jgi:hypothetical protein
MLSFCKGTPSVGFRMLHFLKHRLLVSPAEVQPNSMLNLTLSLWYKEDCKNTIYPFTPFLDLVLVSTRISLLYLSFGS